WASCTDSACCSANSRRPLRSSSGSPPPKGKKPPLPSMDARLAERELVAELDVAHERVDDARSRAQRSRTDPVEIRRRGDAGDVVLARELRRDLAHRHEGGDLSHDRAVVDRVRVRVDDEPTRGLTERDKEVALPCGQLGLEHP